MRSFFAPVIAKPRNAAASSCRRILLALFVSAIVAVSGHAQDWANFSTVSMTNATTPKLTNRYVCYTDGRDIRCDSPSLYVSTGGLVGIGITPSEELEVSGTISATAFVGDGSGLTNLSVSGDHIVSGSDMVIVNDSMNTVSLSINGSSQYFHPTLGFVGLGVSTTGGISGTTGYFTGNVGIGTTAPTDMLMISGSSSNGTGLHIKAGGVAGSTQEIAFVRLSNTNRNWLLRVNGADSDKFQIRDATANQQRLTIDSSGNVGIATTTPTATLQVSGSLIVSSSAQTTTPSLYVGTNGNVGVGTASPGATYKLDVAGNINTTGYLNLFTTPTPITIQGVNFISRPSGSSQINLLDASNGYWQTLAIYTGNGTASSEKMRLTSAGSVGIGTTTPTATLHVSGTARITSWTAIAANVTPTTELDVYGTISATNLLINGQAIGGQPDRITSGTTNVIATQDRSVTITTSGTQRLVIGENGYVGIGTASPARQVHAWAPTGNTAEAQFESNAATVLRVQAASTRAIIGTDTNHALRFKTNATERMSIDGSGNVGIATTTPAATLQVSGSFIVSTSAQTTTPSLYIGANGRVGVGTIAPSVPFHVAEARSWFSANSEPYALYLRYANSGNGIFLGASSAENLQISTAGGSALATLTSTTGSLGLGTASPLAKLDVVGTISLTNALQLGQTTLACATGVSGSIRYNTISNTVQFCNGTGWASLSSGTAAGGSPAGSTGDVQFNNADSFGADTGQFTWDASNNRLGLGLTAPSHTLHVSASLPRIALSYGIPGNTAGEVSYHDETGNMKWSSGIYSDGATNTGLRNGYYIYQYDDQSDAVVNAYRLFITDDGNASIGGSLSPTATLQVSGTFIVSTSAQTTTPSFYVESGGDIGIGTSNPATKFNILSDNAILRTTFSTSSSNATIQVKGDSTATLDIRTYGTAAAGTLLGQGRIGRTFLYADNADLAVGTADSNYVVLATSNTEKVRLTAAGNLGIGTNSPLATLQVSGTISASDAIQLGQGSLTCASGVSGSIRYNTTSNSVQFCNGTGWTSLNSGTTVASALASLTDVQLSNTAGRDYLRYDALASKWVNISESVAMSTTTITPNWPDAIRCSYVAGADMILYRYNMTSVAVNYMSVYGSNNRSATFDLDGTYSANVSLYDGGYDCIGPSISDLYASGQAFNFIGNTALGDRITSGTINVIANAGSGYVSLTNGATNWGYFGSTASFLPTLYANNVGVGTTNATATLQVSGTFTVSLSTQTSTPTLFIGSNGNVGIGTNAAVASLTTFGDIYLDSAGSTNRALYFRNQNTIGYVHSDQALGFKAGGNIERMRINTTGNVGISTITPTSTLQVSGTFTVSTSAQTTTPSLYVSSSGRVGIGTNAPSDMLHISAPASTNAALRISSNNGNTNNILRVVDGSTGGLQIQNGAGVSILAFDNVNKSISASDAIQVGTSSLTCNSSISGSIRYNTTSNTIQFCNGTGWASLSSGTAVGGSPAGSTGDVQFNNAGSFAADTGQLFWDATNNRLGLGMATPTTTLQVSGSFTVSNSAQTTTPTLYVGTNGYVGIGTSGPGYMLHVLSTTTAGNGDNVLRPVQRWQVNHSNSLRMIEMGIMGNWQAGYLQGGDAAGNFYNIALNPSGANVGIGTTNPSTKLEVSGAISATSLRLGVPSSAPSLLTVQDASAPHISSIYSGSSSAGNKGHIAFYHLRSNDSATETLGYIQGVAENSQSNGGLRFVTRANGDVETMRMTSAGNVGIGTSTPGMALDVSGTNTMFRLYNSLHGSIYAGVDSNQPWFGTPSNNSLRLIISSSEVMRLASGGNVGIGTSTPGQKLTIDGSAPNAEIRSGGYLMLRPIANDWDMRLQAAAYRLDVLSGGNLSTPIASFANGGNVGIGTIAPLYTLDLNSPTTGSSAYIRVSAASGYDTGLLFKEASESYGFTIKNSNGSTGLSGLNVLRHSASSPGVSALFIHRDTGNVGIGTTDPQAPLQVFYQGASNGASFTRTDTVSATVSMHASSGDPQFTFTRAGTSSFSAGNDAGVFRIERSAAVGAVTTGITLNAVDNVGIGTNAPTHRLHIVSSTAAVAVISAQNGTGTCTYTPASSGTGTWACSSDERLKKDIDDTTHSGVGYLSTFRIRDFTMKSDGSRQTGVIAQEVLKAHPDMVHKDEKGFYMVDEPHKWLIVKAVQELKAANDNLRDDLDELRAEINALKAAQSGHRKSTAAQLKPR